MSDQRPQEREADQPSEAGQHQPRVEARGHQGHAAQLPVIAEDAGAGQGLEVEHPEIGVGQEPEIRNNTE